MNMKATTGVSDADLNAEAIFNNASRVPNSVAGNHATLIDTVVQKEIEDGGDDEPALPDEHLECEATQEELQTQGQGLQSRRQGPGTNRPGSGRQRSIISGGQQRRARRSHMRVEPTINNNVNAVVVNVNGGKNQGADVATTVDSRNTNTAATKGTTTNKDINVAPTGRESTNKDSCRDVKTNREEESDAHPAGTKLGHYVFGKSLGKGTFGKVKMAEHILTKENVAIKILEKARIRDRKDIDRISREIKILKKVRHPNVIQLYEIIETETELYLIMEYCINGELFDYIVQHQRLHEKAAIRIFQQLISGIEYIHKSGICHRDLKPENLLLDFDKTLKIVDFGLSNLYEPPEGLLKTACGSPCYAAPEMIAGKKYLGLKSDIWSSGVVLYAMVCGFLPFEDPKTSNLYKKIMAGEFKIPRFLSTDCSHFIAKVLQTDPNERYGIDQIREHPWYRQFRDKQPSGLFPGQELMPLEDTIYEQILDEFGFDPDYAVKCIEANRHNNITSTYHLLYKRALRQQKPFTNVSHVTGSLDRAAIAQYERREADYQNNQTCGPANERQSRFNEWQREAGIAPVHQKRGTSTNYNCNKNANALQSVNGGPETANLKPDQNTTLSVQKRYKLELQAEISKLREKYSAVKKHPAPTGNQHATEKQQSLLDETAQSILQPHSALEPTPQRFVAAGTRINQKRTERQKYSRRHGQITDDSEKVSPDTNPRRPQNRVNIVQIQNQQHQEVTSIEETKEQKQNSTKVITNLPPNERLVLPAKNQKQVKQYSSQPGNSSKPQRLSAEREQFVFNGSEIEEGEEYKIQDCAEGQRHPNEFETLEDQSAQKVSTISSLTGGAQSAITRTKMPSATTTKGSQVLRSFIQKKRSETQTDENSGRAIQEQFLNSSMPITLPTQQATAQQYVVRQGTTKSGGRKLNSNNTNILRYRQQKTSSGNAGVEVGVAGCGLEEKGAQQFNTIGDPSDVAMQMSIRSKKNVAYVSLNSGNQTLINNSLDMSHEPAAPTYTTIAQGKQSSNNVTQVPMAHRQFEHLANSINKTSHVRQPAKANQGQSAGRAAAGAPKYNLNRASLGGIIGQQKHIQAQRAKQQQVIPNKVTGSGLMPSINENFENLQMIGQPHMRQGNHQHPAAIKHRQSFKQTANQTQLVGNEGSPQNQASILARRAGSQQWRNNSLSNKGGRDSVNSNHSQQQQQHNVLFQSQSGKRVSNFQQPQQHSQVHVAHQTTASAGDYDFTTVDPLNASGLPFAKHSHHPARIITSSESGQVSMSKPLQLTHINPTGFGQTSENQMNLFQTNTIDFHHTTSNPQSNSRIYSIQQTGPIPNGNKAQQMKNRKGINQSIDFKPQHAQQIKQGLRAQSHLGSGTAPSSQISRKSAQSRQFAFESDLSNNYASQISGWVNQSILPAHQQQQAEMLDQSAVSIKSKMRHGKRDTSAQDSQASNYAIQQIYQQYAGEMKGTQAATVKGKITTKLNPQQRAVHTVLENHDHLCEAVQQVSMQQPAAIAKKLSKDNNNMAIVGGPQQNIEQVGTGRAGILVQQYSAGTPNAHKPSVKIAKSQEKKGRIQIPQSLIQKGSTNLRANPLTFQKKLPNQTTGSFSVHATRSFMGKSQQPNR